MHEKIVYQPKLSENQSLADVLKARAGQLMQQRLPKAFDQPNVISINAEQTTKVKDKIVPFPGAEETEIRIGEKGPFAITLSVPVFVAMAFMDFNLFPDDDETDNNSFKNLNRTQLSNVLTRLDENDASFIKTFGNEENITLDKIISFFKDSITAIESAGLSSDEVTVLTISLKQYLESVFQDDSAFVEALQEALAQA